MELLGALIGAGLVAAAPLVPGLRPVAKAVVKGGMAVAEASVAVAVIVSHEVGDLVSHVRPTAAGETIIAGETMAPAEAEAPSVEAMVADGPETTEPVKATAEFAGAAAASASAPSLRPAAKTAVKSGVALADAAKGAAVGAMGAVAVAGKQLGGLAASVKPAKKSGDASIVDADLPVEVVEMSSPETPSDAVPAPSEKSSSIATEAKKAQPSAADDLVLIKGIGPKAATMLQEAGIATYAHLAATPVEQLRAILDKGGAPFRVTDPSSWPAQAQALIDNPPQAKPFDDADLVQIDGIGPKIAAMLQEAGITTVTQLAATPVEQLRAILDQGGARYRVTDPTSWPGQAQSLLAAAGQS